jgi:transcription elongation factor GreA
MLTLPIFLDKNMKQSLIPVAFSRLKSDAWRCFLGKILLTRAGYEKLVQELEVLSRVERPQVVRELLEAAQEGGVEKNPDFQSALTQRQQLDRRIKQLQQTLANAEVLVGSNLRPDRVRFNSKVRVRSLDTGREQEFRLVGTLEADASAGRLSMTSPLGRALLGHASGDKVQVNTPRGVRSYQILEIRMAEV